MSISKKQKTETEEGNKHRYWIWHVEIPKKVLTAAPKTFLVDILLLTVMRKTREKTGLARKRIIGSVAGLAIF